MKLAGVFLLCYAAIVAADSEGPNTRISNYGEVASEGEFPFLVSIQMGTQHFCGGSLISKTHVLTAAHCVQPGVDIGYFASPINIEVGTTRLGHGKRYRAKRISYLRGFYMQDPGNRFLPNDVAVIHLTEPVLTSDKVAIVNLPAAGSSLPPGTKVVTAGFGVDDVRSTQISYVLKKMDAKVTALEECQKYLLPRLHLGKMCAGKGAGYGTCKGDSGGPLVDETRRTIIGIVSGGDGECKKGTPDVYTEVSRFLSYINEELNWQPGSNSQNPALNLETQGGVKPPGLPSPPTQFPTKWPWPQQPGPKPPQNPLQPNPPQNPPQSPQKPFGPQKPVPCVPNNDQLYDLNNWKDWAVGQPCPPGWRPMKPEQPLNPPQSPPQSPWKPQQPWTEKPDNPFTQKPQWPPTLKPNNPWNPQQPQNPFQPLDPLDPSNPDLEESISDESPFTQKPQWPPTQKPQWPPTQKPQWPPTQKPHYPWNPQQPQNPFQPKDPLDPSNPELEESISA